MHLVAGTALPERHPEPPVFSPRPRAICHLVVVVRVCSIEDFTLASIVGPAKSETDRARVVLAVDDTGEVKILKDTLGDAVRVIG